MQLNYLSNSGKKNISTKMFINITILLSYFNAECLLLGSKIACSFVQSKHANVFQNKLLGSALSFLLFCYLSCYTYFCKSFKALFISALYGLSWKFQLLLLISIYRNESTQARISILPSAIFSFIITPLLVFCSWARIKWEESSKAEWLQETNMIKDS